MNNSFESPSHLERRIRMELEQDFDDSSLSAPGFGRRATSESLSFATDEGSDDGGRTSTGRSRTGGNSTRILGGIVKARPQEQEQERAPTPNTATPRQRVRELEHGNDHDHEHEHDYESYAGASTYNYYRGEESTPLPTPPRATLAGALAQQRPLPQRQQVGGHGDDDDDDEESDISQSQSASTSLSLSRSDVQQRRGTHTSGRVGQAQSQAQSQGQRTHSHPLSSTPARPRTASRQQQQQRTALAPSDLNNRTGHTRNTSIQPTTTTGTTTAGLTRKSNGAMTAFYSQRTDATSTATATVTANQNGRTSLARRAAERAAAERTHTHTRTHSHTQTATFSSTRAGDEDGEEEALAHRSQTPFGSAREQQSPLAASASASDVPADAHTHDISVQTIEEAQSADVSRLHQDDDEGEGEGEQGEQQLQHSQSHRTYSDTDDGKGQEQQQERSQRTYSDTDDGKGQEQQQERSRHTHSLTEDVTPADSDAPDAPESSPAAARAIRATQSRTPEPHSANDSNSNFVSDTPASNRQHAAPMSTPKPRIDPQRMQSYVLSTVKDPIREERIQRSVRAQRIRAARQAGQAQLDFEHGQEHEYSGEGQYDATQRAREETPSPAPTPAAASSSPSPFGATPSNANLRRMDRLGRPMTLGAGRTPLPFRPSRLGRHVFASGGGVGGGAGVDDSSSQNDAVSASGDGESSTGDLMTPARGWANTSEPGFGAIAEGRGAAHVGNRVDPRKLSRQVHKMNENLEEENHLLRGDVEGAQAEVETLRRQLNVALREKEGLGRRVRALEEKGRSEDAKSPKSIPLPASPNLGDADRDADADADEHDLDADADPDSDAPRSYKEALQKIAELQGHKEELNDMLDDLEERYEALEKQVEAERQRKGGAEAGADADVTATATATATLTGEQGHSRSQSLRSGRSARSHRSVDPDRTSAAELRAQLEQVLTELTALEEELAASQEERDQLRDNFEEAKDFALRQCEESEGARDEALREAEALRSKVQALEEEVRARADRSNRDDHDDGSSSKAHSTSDSDSDRAQADVLRKQLGMAREEIDAAEEEHARARAELEAALESNELELQALEEAQALSEEKLAGAQADVEALKEELDAERIRVSERDNQLLRLERANTTGEGKLSSRIAELEAQLEVAQTEAEAARGKLREMVSRGEHDAAVKIKESELEELRRQKQEVEARLEDYKQQAQALSQSFIDAANTHANADANASGSASNSLQTPARGSALHRTLMHLRTPVRTPASPGHLSAASWLNETTIGAALGADSSAAVHIAELQRLLDEANAKLDEKLAEMDAQGIGHLTLTRRLIEATLRIEELERELEALRGAPSQAQMIKIRERLEKIRCTKCEVRFDASRQVPLPRSGSGADGEQDTDATATADHTHGRSLLGKSTRSKERDRALEAFIAKIPVLTERLAEMEEENRALRDAQAAAAKDKNAKQAKDAESKASQRARRRELARKLQAGTQGEITRAREAIVDLDAELAEERRRLPELARDSKLFGDASAAAERELERTEMRLRTVEGELRRKAEEFERLQEEFVEVSRGASALGDDDASASAAVDAPVSLHVLQAQIRQTALELQHLREDRQAVLSSRRGLHAQFRSASESYAAVQSELAHTRSAVEAHRAQLAQQSDKVASLHAALRAQDADLAAVSGERDRLAEQRQGIIRDVGALEADLVRVRAESERFGVDLERLRRERDEQRERAERARETSISVTAEAHETIGVLRTRLEAAQRAIREMELQAAVEAEAAEAARVDADAGKDQAKAGEDPQAATAAALAALRAKHTAEAKGLLVHIRYLKTRYMREADLRQDLAFQKGYLLQVLGGLSLSEEETVRFLADLKRSRGAGAVGASASASAGSARARPRAKLKRAALAVLAVSKMRLMARRWAETRRVKEALLGARDEARVRRRERERGVQESEGKSCEGEGKGKVGSEGADADADADADETVKPGNVHVRAGRGRHAATAAVSAGKR